MDPKKYSNLDPKLKEAYERVMGTKVPAVAQPPQPTPQTTAVYTPKPAPLTTPAAKPSSPQPITTTQKPVSPISVAKPNGMAVLVKPSSSKLLIFIFIILGIIFFVGYAFFWIKFFNIPLPFTLPFNLPF